MNRKYIINVSNTKWKVGKFKVQYLMPAVLIFVAMIITKKIFVFFSIAGGYFFIITDFIDDDNKCLLDIAIQQIKWLLKKKIKVYPRKENYFEFN